MLTISKKVLIVPVGITIIGVLMMIFLGHIYYFMLATLPAWLTMLFLLNRNLKRRASAINVSYVCQACGKIFKDDKCPRCGSKSRKAKF
ncbi:MAG: hypothetical protein ACE5J2_04950 [Nitrososphaerales archaeon]